MAADTVEGKKAERAPAAAGAPPASVRTRPPVPDLARVTSRRRIETAQALVLEIQALRTAFQESLQQYELRMQGQFAEVLTHLQGGAALDERPHVPSTKTAAAMLHAIRTAELKPRKGRAKDLVRLQELVAHLTEMLPPRN